MLDLYCIPEKLYTFGLGSLEALEVPEALAVEYSKVRSIVFGGANTQFTR